MDPLLATRLDEFGPPPDFRRPTGLPTLVRIILEQGVSLKAAEEVFHRILHETDSLDLRRLSEADPARIQAAGTTAVKARCIVRLAREVVEGDFDLESLVDLDDSSAFRGLVRHHGVGPWTAQIYLMTALARPDVWPDGDLAVRRELGRDGIHDRTTRHERAARWSPHRSTAAFLLWHAYLSRKPARQRPAGRLRA